MIFFILVLDAVIGVPVFWFSVHSGLNIAQCLTATGLSISLANVLGMCIDLSRPRRRR